MKHIQLILTLSILLVSIANGQEIMVESGKSVTSFDFSDAQSNILGNMQSTTQNYISFGYRRKIVKDFVFVIAGAGVNSYGAKGSDDNQNFYEWETTYLSIYAGFDTKVVEYGNMALTLRLTLAPEFIIQGTQYKCVCSLY